VEKKDAPSIKDIDVIYKTFLEKRKKRVTIQSGLRCKTGKGIPREKEENGV